MELEGFLIGFAQLSLVLTGFVSVFVVFMISEEDKSRVNTHHAVAILVGSLISTISALLPIVLNTYGVVAPALWWWSSLGVLLLGGVNFLIMMSLTVQLTKDQFKEAGYIHMGASYGAGTIAFLIIAWNVFVEVSVGNYLLAVILTFLISVIGFVTFSVQKIFHW